MTIKLNSLTIIQRRVTDNWSEYKLMALDCQGQSVCIAHFDYATGALGEFPHCTKQRALTNAQTLQLFLRAKEITKYQEWEDIASDYYKAKFRRICNQTAPNFTH